MLYLGTTVNFCGPLSLHKCERSISLNVLRNLLGKFTQLLSLQMDHEEYKRILSEAAFEGVL